MTQKKEKGQNLEVSAGTKAAVKNLGWARLGSVTIGDEHVISSSAPLGLLPSNLSLRLPHPHRTAHPPPFLSEPTLTECPL